MNRIKYQIFISSTYEDLKEERDQVIKACLEMGHIPVGMEMFSAADEEQWLIIARQIEASDYYVVIVANKYGSTVDGISYTEKEYDYAISKGVPVLGFVLKDGAMWHSDRGESETKVRRKLDAFKKKVKGRPVNFWATKEELHGQCAIALMKAFNTSQRPGWLPATEFGGPEITAELSRLSTENAKLRVEVEEYKKLTDVSAFAQGEEETQLSFHIINRQDDYNRSSGTVAIYVSWNNIFLSVAETLVGNQDEYKVREAINLSFGLSVLDLFGADKTNGFEEKSGLYAVVNSDDLSRIRNQFVALKLIKIGQDVSKYDGSISKLWKITVQGMNYYASLVAQPSLKHTDN